MKVKVFFRNYIPLNQPYSSFMSDPPDEVQFDIPKTRKYLKNFFPMYQRFGGNKFFAKAVKLTQNLVFSTKVDNSKKDFDVALYIGMVPDKKTQFPYVVDLEHVVMLLNNVKYSEKDKSKLMEALKDENCKRIVPISIAAQRSLEKFLGPRYPEIKRKVEVVYPAIPDFKEKFRGQMDPSVLGEHNDEVRFLFVGADGYRKGILEVISAFNVLSKEFKKIRLIIVSNDSEKLEGKYGNNKMISFFEGKYQYFDFIKKFFLASDIFVMPTHADSFGMVYLDALSSGLPVILTKQFATPEIVEDGVNGLFLNHEKLFLDRDLIPKERFGKDYILSKSEESNIISELVKKMRYLILNPKVRFMMSKNTEKEFKPGGKFSVKVRNEKLTRIFKEALGEK